MINNSPLHRGRKATLTALVALCTLSTAPVDGKATVLGKFTIQP